MNQFTSNRFYNGLIWRVRYSIRKRPSVYSLDNAGSAQKKDFGHCSSWGWLMEASLHRHGWLNYWTLKRNITFNPFFLLGGCEIRLKILTWFLMRYPICQTNNNPLRDLQPLANQVVYTLIQSWNQRFHGYFELYVGKWKQEYMVWEVLHSALSMCSFFTG